MSEAKRWFADTIKRMEDGIVVEYVHGNPLASNPNEAWVPVMRASDYDLLAAELADLKARLANDAERYRWVRKRLIVTAVHCREEEVTMFPLDKQADSHEDYCVEVDAAIDAARAAGKGEKP